MYSLKMTLALLCIVNCGFVLADEAGIEPQSSLSESCDENISSEEVDPVNLPIFIQYTSDIFAAAKTFQKTYPRKVPKLKCVICKTRKFSYAEFYGYLIGRMLAILGDETFDETLKSIADGLIKVLSEGTPDQVADYMLASMGFVKMGSNSSCKGHVWKKVASRARSQPQNS